MGFAGHSEKKYLEDPYIYSVIPRPVDPLSPSWPWSSSSFPLFASVRILRSACGPEKGEPSGVEARVDLGQRLPMCQLFRASGQMAARPCLSFPPPPLKFRTVGFPQYGFKLALAPATFTRLPAFIGRSGSRVRVGLGASRNPGSRPGGTPPSRPQTTSPVALGSPPGYSVQAAHRLLWPHPRL